VRDFIKVLAASYTLFGKIVWDWVSSKECGGDLLKLRLYWVLS
jgi:hypothetical protein